MKLDKLELYRFQRQLPLIYSDPTTLSRKLSPVRMDGPQDSNTRFKSLSPYITEIRRTRNFSTANPRQPSPQRSFRIHQQLYRGRTRDSSLPTKTTLEAQPLATIYQPRSNSPSEQNKIFLPITTLSKLDKGFMRTKFKNLSEQAVLETATGLNPDNLRKLAYTVAAGKAANQESEEPLRQEDTILPRKKFRQNKYVLSDEVKHSVRESPSREEEVDHENLLDYVEQDSELPNQQLPDHSPHLEEHWPDRHRSLCQIQMELCRLSSQVIGSTEDPPADRDDFVSELQHPRNNRPGLCADFTFEVGNRPNKKQCSQLL